MNRFYLDEDRVIEADMSSDASPGNDDLIFRQKQVNLRDLSFHFSRYCHEFKRQITKQLGNISRDLNLLTSCFLDESVQADHQDPLKIITILKAWIPKLEQFEEKFKDLKNYMPYLPGQKKKVSIQEPRRIKIIEIIDRIISKYDGPIKQENSTNAIESPSKLQHSFHLSKIQHLHDQGKYEQCIIKSKEHLRVHQSPELYFLLANSYKALGLYRDSIAQYTRAINLIPRGCYYNNRGNAYLSINQINKAENDYKAAIDLEPKNQVFLGNYGNICLSLKKFKEAIQVYNKAIAIDQENDFFYNNRAFAQIKLGEMNAAIESYNHAINLNPHNHIYLKNRANLFMEKKNIKWALDDISKAISIEPKHQYYFLKGKWEYRCGRQHDALNSFRKACQLEPGKQSYQKLYVAMRSELGYK